LALDLRFRGYSEFKKVASSNRTSQGMLVGQQTRKWICRVYYRKIYHKRLFSTSLLRWQDVEGVPPGLIVRARKLAQQHQELEQKAAEMTEYTPQSIQIYKRISELASVASNLKEFQETQMVIPLKLS
jgi:hypothetical protein